MSDAAEPYFAWSGSAVSPEGQLNVRVENSYPELDAELGRVVERRSREVRLEPWGTLSYRGTWLSVVRVEPGTEDQLRDALVQMLKIAHKRAKPLQARRDADDQRESTEAAARAEKAEAQQQRCRSFGSDANS